MGEKFLELKGQHEDQLLSVAWREFGTSKGDKFAKHGFLRRCGMLWRCIEKTFDALPPELDEKPCEDDTRDVSLFLQSFVVHVFGACDDLAWILVHEKRITKPDGKELPPAWIGLRKGNTAVRSALSSEMTNLLDSYEAWFKHVEDFRHSLAHRIPLYVPPYFVPHDRESDYHRLEKESWQALLEGDIDKSRQLQEDKDALTFFRPWYAHSISEGSPHMVIHPQMLADFGSVLELGKAVFGEL